MFKENGNEKQLAEALNIKVENVDELLKRMSGFLVGRKIISKRNLADSLFILIEIQRREKEKEIIKMKVIIRNPTILKYNTKIIELYQAGYGYVRISKILKTDHNIKISKSTIARFIKDYGVSRNG